MRINAFLVEDKPDIRKALVDAMEEMAPMRFVGHADDELGAREWLQANDARWDVAIIDLFLAEGTGFGVLRDCKARHPNQKVIVLTSYVQPNVLDRCHEMGADVVFDKSTEVGKLVQFCRAHAAELGGKRPQDPAAATPPAPHDGRSTPLFTQNSLPQELL